MTDLFIEPLHLLSLLGAEDAPILIDLRDADDRDADRRCIPGADLCYLEDLDTRDLRPDRLVVAICQKGGKLSQLAAADLRQADRNAVVLRGGFLDWIAQGLPVQRQTDLGAAWVCPTDPTPAELSTLWLLRRWLAPEANVAVIERVWIEKATQQRPLRDLSGLTPRMLSEESGLEHPDLMQALSDLPPERAIRGRLRRDADPLIALDILDDWVAGAGA